MADPARWDAAPASTTADHLDAITDLGPRARIVLNQLGQRPASVRQIQDRLDRPTMGAQRWNRHQVRYLVEVLVEAGLAARSRGRLRWTVRYKRTPAGDGHAR